MLAKPYQILSSYYDVDWGAWCCQYIPFLDEMLAQYCTPGDKILDCACGTGRLIQELSAKGYLCFGFDRSPEMIDIARGKKIPNALFSVQQLQNFNYESKFKLITCTFDAFNYLVDPGDVNDFFRGIKHALAPDGVLVFDSNTDKLFRFYHNGIVIRTINGTKFIQERFYDDTLHIASSRFCFEDGRSELHFQRPYDLDDLKDPITDAGLTIAFSYGGFNKEPYSDICDRLIVGVSL